MAGHSTVGPVVINVPGGDGSFNLAIPPEYAHNFLGIMASDNEGAAVLASAGTATVVLTHQCLPGWEEDIPGSIDLTNPKPLSFAANAVALHVTITGMVDAEYVCVRLSQNAS